MKAPALWTLAASAVVVVAVIATAPTPARASGKPSASAAAKPAAPTADPAAVVSAKRALQQAALGDMDALMKARAQFEALSASAPKSAALHYWVALADYRVVPRHFSGDKTLAARYLTDGLDHLDKALAIDPKFADAIALKAGSHGLAIMLDPSRAMALGPQIEEELRQAGHLAPKNPRVALLDGINLYNKPMFVGGGPDLALPRLIEAQKLFAAVAPSDSTAIDWGQDDAYVWAGRSAMLLGKPSDAVAYYHKALEINPANGWVRGSLLPEAEKAAAAPKGKS